MTTKQTIKEEWEKEFDGIVLSYRGAVKGYTLLETMVKLKSFIRSLLKKNRQELIGEVRGKLLEYRNQELTEEEMKGTSYDYYDKNFWVNRVIEALDDLLSKTEKN